MAELSDYFYIEAEELTEKLQRHSLALEKDVEWREDLVELKRAAHSLKGAARLVQYFDIGDLAHKFEDQLALLSKASDRPNGDVTTDLLKTIDQLAELIKSRKNGNGTVTQPEPVRELSPAPVPVSPVPAPAAPPTPEAHDGSRQQEHFARVDTNVLEEIGRSAGELIEINNRIEHLRAGWEQLRKSADAGVVKLVNDLEGALERLGPLSTKLHRLGLATRLVPVKREIFRFEKVVRTTANAEGKSVEFVAEGTDTNIDIVVLQSLAEPLAHLLRNSIVHGIESPERRGAKRPAGTIKMIFSRTQDRVRIVVEDDGRGIDSEQISRTRSQQNGQPQKELQKEELSALIFQSGFSTKSEVSSVAGRGVGLDIVRNAVQKLTGKIKVDWERGLWCRFTIDVPSNLDVLEAFVVESGGQDLLIPLSQLMRTAIVTDSEIVDDAGNHAILINSSPVRIVSLNALLRLGGSGRSDAAGRQVIVVNAEGALAAFFVDELKGKQRVVIKNAHGLLEASGVVAGNAIMSDGRPGFLLSAQHLVQLAHGSRMAASPVREAAKVKKHLLVVDDSLTTRMLEKTILEAAGYLATLVGDGEQAMAIVDRQHFDLLIVDFEMPGMNGIELIERVRQKPNCQDVPVVMLTSRGSDADKRKGLAAGAQAYLVKGKFDQSEFLTTIRRLVGDL